MPEEQVLVSPDAGCELGGEHQVRDVCLLPAQLPGGAHGKHPVQPRARGDGHQLGVDIVLVVIRKREPAVRHKVEGEGKNWIIRLGSVLAVPDECF